MATFAMMLRCSYSRVRAGMAFVNCLPVVADLIAKKRFTVSLFSEWVVHVMLWGVQIGSMRVSDKAL